MIDTWVYLAVVSLINVRVVTNPGTGPHQKKPLSSLAITTNSLRDIHKRLHCPHGVVNETPNHLCAIPQTAFHRLVLRISES